MRCVLPACLPACLPLWPPSWPVGDGELCLPRRRQARMGQESQPATAPHHHSTTPTPRSTSARGDTRARPVRSPNSQLSYLPSSSVSCRGPGSIATATNSVRWPGIDHRIMHACKPLATSLHAKGARAGVLLPPTGAWDRRCVRPTWQPHDHGAVEDVAYYTSISLRGWM